MKNPILITFLPILFYSCSGSLYNPSTLNTPLFSEKGEIELVGTAGLGGNLQVAYALTNHIAITGNYSKYGLGYARRSSSDIITRGTGKEKGLGLGYFHQTNSGINLDLFTGFSNISNQTKINYVEKTSNNFVYTFYNPKFDIKATKYYLQPSFGWVKKNVEFAINCRLSNLYFQKPNSEVPDSIMLIKDLYNLKSNFGLIEPGMTFRFGTKFVKFQIQYLKSFSIKRQLGINNTGGNFSFGLFSKFPTKKKKLPQI